MREIEEAQLLARWQSEAEKGIDGWDFSPVSERLWEEPLPWSYRLKVKDFLKPDTRLLDMGTGGGERLLSFGHPPALTAATEGWEPNYQLCLKRLTPLGITVKAYDSERDPAMPFEDETFDLIINRHESYDLPEVYRILKKGGFFLTQQVGGQNSRSLTRFLLPEAKRGMEAFNLENQTPLFRQAGFRIQYCNQSYGGARFTDIGALCWYARISPWEFPDFSVQTCFPQLLKLHKEINRRGFVETERHRFILIGKKRG